MRRPSCNPCSPPHCNCTLPRETARQLWMASGRFLMVTHGAAAIAAQVVMAAGWCKTLTPWCSHTWRARTALPPCSPALLQGLDEPMHAAVKRRPRCSGAGHALALKSTRRAAWGGGSGGSGADSEQNLLGGRPRHR
jgi:hypothetical protein